MKWFYLHACLLNKVEILRARMIQFNFSTKYVYFLLSSPQNKCKKIHSILFFYWSIVDLQYYVSFKCTEKWFGYFFSFSFFHYRLFSSVQSLSHVRLFATPWIAARQASLSITNSRSSPKLMSIELVMPSHPLLSPFPAFTLSQHQGLF